MTDGLTVERAVQLLPRGGTKTVPRSGRVGTAQTRDHSERPTRIQTQPTARIRPHDTHGPGGAPGVTILRPRGRTAMLLPSRDTRSSTHAVGQYGSSARASTEGRRPCPRPRYASPVVRCDASWAPAGQRAKRIVVWVDGCKAHPPSQFGGCGCPSIHLITRTSIAPGRHAIAPARQWRHRSRRMHVPNVIKS